ncbi:MAG: 5-bromo-4-chloroindolyl phosphate hydrolysis family protein [Clostridia bacterium]|nr:5-bromo-4-chloroindolyl phosphate hydrolysis family protein [Clostridia bacterium]
MAKKNNPNSNPKAGRIGFLISAFLLAGGGYSLFRSVGTIVAGVVIGLGIGKLVSIMGSGLDTTTHNKEDVERQRREEEEASRRKEEAERARRKEEAERKAREASSKVPLTGDAAADAVITKGLEMVETIRKDNAAIPDPVLSGQMEAICEKCVQIFRAVSEAPSKAPQVRKFMNYYLPTTLKMLANYRTMQDRGVSVQDMATARDTTVRGLNMILTACQKQIDNLHKENLLDISTDIDVLEQMLKRDGYTESELNGIKDPIPAEPRTAAEAQMRASGAPVMNFPESRSQEQTSYKPGSYRYQDQ